MNLTVRESKIKTIRQSDPLFTITDGLMVAHRAGIEVGNACPYEYRLIISECLDRGWIAPVAYMTAEEQLMETLKL